MENLEKQMLLTLLSIDLDYYRKQLPWGHKKIYTCISFHHYSAAYCDCDDS